MTVLVVDVEATCWPDDQPELRNRQREISEIIEIGAVRLQRPELVPDGEFQRFVRPVVHPELSPFCTRLTTIEQSDVDDAPLFSEAYAELVNWLSDGGRGVTMVSWSAYDQQLFARQCGEAGLEGHPRWGHVDLKAEFGRWMFAHHGERARYRLAEALSRAGLPSSGQAHRAIDDARNTAALLRHIRAPEALSPLAKHAVRVLAQRDPSPTHAGHMRGVLPDAKRWFARIAHELLRTGLATDLGGGRGLRLTQFGRSVLPRLDLDALPSPRDPERPTA